MSDPIRHAAENVFAHLYPFAEETSPRWIEVIDQIESLLRDTLKPTRVWVVHLEKLVLKNDLWQHGEYWGSKRAAENYAGEVFPLGGSKVSSFDVIEVDDDAQ